MKNLRGRFPLRKWGLRGGELKGSMLKQGKVISTVLAESKHAKDITPAEARRNDKPDECATLLGTHNHLSTTQQGDWLAVPQPCISKPTVGRIRKANQWIRRARQFAELQWTHARTGYSTKHQEGTGRTQGRHITAATDPLINGSVDSFGLEVAQADTTLHVDFGWRSQGFDFGSGTLGVAHVHVRHCTFSPPSLENSDTCMQRLFNSAVFQPSVWLAARFLDQTWGTGWNRRQTLCHQLSHHPWMLATNERNLTVGADGSDAG